MHDSQKAIDAAAPPDASVGQAKKTSRRFSRFKWIVRLSVLAFIVGCFIVGFDGFFYYPTSKIYYSPDEFGLRYERVEFKTSDGLMLAGLFFPAQGRSKGAVIHLHGNAGNVSAHFPLSTWLAEAGYDLLVFDYRGYGRSQGKVTRAGTIRDGHAALDYLISRPEIDETRIFAFGQSLGGAVAAVVAAERPQIRAVVLDSTFSGYRRIGSRHLQRTLYFKWLADLIARAGLSDEYDPVDYIARIAPRPLLIIASAEDEICFAELGRELYEAAPEPKQFILVDRSEHLGTVIENVDDVQQSILNFFNSAP